MAGTELRFDATEGRLREPALGLRLTAPLGIRDLADLLAVPGLYGDSSYDSDELWEWVQARHHEYDVEIELRRRHEWEEPDFTKPLLVRLAFAPNVPDAVRPALVREAAKSIAVFAAVEVEIGTWTHLYDDEIDFDASDRVGAVFA